MDCRASRLRFTCSTSLFESPPFSDQDFDLLEAWLMRRSKGITGFYNDIARWFQHDPGHFEPTFYERRVKGKRIFIVDEWCRGFMKGARLNSTDGKPLKRDRPELLRPMELFGTTAGFRELEAGGEDVMHVKWSPKITPAVRAIHAYWLPQRHADYEAVLAAKPMRRERLRVGRNDPCPCGSGKKFKLCCGVPGGTVH